MVVLYYRLDESIMLHYNKINGKTAHTFRYPLTAVFLFGDPKKERPKSLIQGIKTEVT